MPWILPPLHQLTGDLHCHCTVMHPIHAVTSTMVIPNPFCWKEEWMQHARCNALSDGTATVAFIMTPQSTGKNLLTGLQVLGHHGLATVGVVHHAAFG